MALSGATIPGQSGPGSSGSEGMLHIPQSPSIIVETCCHSDSSERPSANTGEKNSWYYNNNNKRVISSMSWKYSFQLGILNLHSW